MNEHFTSIHKTNDSEFYDRRELELAVDNLKSHLIFYELEERLELVQSAIVEAERCNGINL
jgi:hypothetical protein